MIRPDAAALRLNRSGDFARRAGTALLYIGSQARLPADCDARAYTSRGASGCERLLHALTHSPGNVRFICGEARQQGADLVIRPLSVVFEEDGRRSCIQPWVDENQATASAGSAIVHPHRATTVDPLQDYLDELLDRLADRWLMGPVGPASTWSQLSALGSSLGLANLADFSALDKPARLLELTVAADFAFREFDRQSA